MSLKDWCSSKSYRQAAIDHAKNAKPYLQEVVIAAVFVYGFYCVFGPKKQREISQIKNSQDNKDQDSTTAKPVVELVEQPVNVSSTPAADTKTVGLQNLNFDERAVVQAYRYTKHPVAPYIILPAAANTGIQLAISYSEGEGFSTGLSNSWKQIKDAAYGAKEIGYCVGNAVGYLGTIIADGIYEQVIRARAIGDNCTELDGLKDVSGDSLTLETIEGNSM